MTGNIPQKFIPHTPASVSVYTVTQEYPHYHEGVLEIAYCFRGPAYVYTRAQTFVLNDGDIISFDPHDIHYIYSSEDNLMVSFYFNLTDPVFDKPDLEKIYFVCEKSTTPAAKEKELLNLKRLLLTLLYFYCFPHRELQYEDIITNFSKQIIRTMLEHFHYFHFISNSQDCSEELKNRFERILIYISDHYSEKITIETLCRIEHLSYKYLSSFFKKTSYVGFSRFVNNVRLYESSILLLNTEKNISDISYEVGFSAPVYYYRTFRQWCDMTPNQCRKELKKLRENACGNTYYQTDSIKKELEHYIAFYFAAIQIPQLWHSQFVPLKGVPKHNP